MAKRFAVIDGRAESALAEPLTALGYEVLALPAFDKLDTPVSAHPDMLLWAYKNKIITHGEYYPIAKDIFDRLAASGYEIILSEQKISAKYPLDVPLNCAVVGEHLIANADSASRLILKAASGGLTLLNTRQGYAKCSTFIVDSTAVITADASVEKACRSSDIEVLKIREGHIRLDGYGYGFIGGAGGVDGDRVFFSGDISLHPDGEAIASFCRQHKKKIITLSDAPLFDVGTIFFL